MSRAEAHPRSSFRDHELNRAPTTYVSHLDPRRNLPSSDAVIWHYEFILRRFGDDHARHTRPPTIPYGDDINRRAASGVCRHLRDTYHQAPPSRLDMIPAHMWSNSPGIRLCLACSRNALRIERYMCGCCGHPNPYTDSHYRNKDRACDIHIINTPPLTLHVPLCHRCAAILMPMIRKFIEVIRDEANAA